MEKIKICTKCGKELPATTEHFHKQKHGKYGLKPRCKDCTGKIDKEYRENHKEYHKQKYKEWYIKNGGYDGYYKNYYQNNIQQYKKARIKNRVKSRETEAIYRSKNKEKIRLKFHKYNAKKKNLEYRFNDIDWMKAKKHFQFMCCYCGKSKKLTKEHFIALNKGGEFTKNNIIPSCSSCNSSKQDSDFFQWYPKQAFYSKEMESKILRYLNYDPETKNQQLSIL